MFFSGAIFDLDGTLIDSMGICESIDKELLAKWEKEPGEGHTEAVRSMGFKESAKYIIERYGINVSAAEFIRQWNEAALRHYSSVRMKAGAREYVEALTKAGVKTAVLTAAPRMLLEAALIGNGISDLFDVIIPSSETGMSKKQPELFFLAAKRLGVDAAQCMVFEDLYMAAKSAKEAGMMVTAVHDVYAGHEEEAMRSLADRYITDFNEILHEDTPLYKSGE
ncbi:MAG: HAD family hydrolase [Christensenellales bacterium]|jgi:HAD superfamily hydrolase (TIGR01509 family)